MDELSTVYEKAFTGIGPSEGVREAVLLMGREASPSPLRFVRRLSTAAAAVLVLLALLGCGAAAVVYGEGIQGFFARQWERLTGAPMDEGQTALIEHLSQNLNLSQTVDGVTVTLDSATVGSDVLYLLVRIDDRSYARDGSFDQFRISLEPEVPQEGALPGGEGWSTQGVDGEGRRLLLFERPFAPGQEGPMEVTLSLTDLCQGAGSDQWVAVEGTWEFQFTLDPVQSPPPVALPDTWATVTDYFTQEQHTGLFTNIEVTSTGLHYDESFPGDNFPLPNFIPFLVLEDGTLISGGSGSGISTGDGNTFRCTRQWSVPVDLSQAAAVRFGDTDIPLP